MERAKLITVSILAALVLIVVLQNTEPVATRILFVTVSMPRALLLLVTGGIGFLIGLLVSLKIRKTAADSDRSS